MLTLGLICLALTALEIWALCRIAAWADANLEKRR